MWYTSRTLCLSCNIIPIVYGLRLYMVILPALLKENCDKVSRFDSHLMKWIIFRHSTLNVFKSILKLDSLCVTCHAGKSVILQNKTKIYFFILTEKLRNEPTVNINIIFKLQDKRPFLCSGVEAKRGVEFCHLNWHKVERECLHTRLYLCLPCHIQDTVWSWKKRNKKSQYILGQITTCPSL